jgi:hypothetical protein
LHYFQRITIEEIREDPWFKKNYVTIRCGEDENVSLDDVQAVFDNIEVCEKLVNPSMLCNSIISFRVNRKIPMHGSIVHLKLLFLLMMILCYVSFS